MKLSTYLFNLALGVDQLFNVLLGGYPDETLSSRCWRMKNKHKAWLLANKTIDAMFFWQKEHCKIAYNSEVKRKHIDLTVY